MGNTVAKQVVPEIVPTAYFLAERMLDTNCGYLEQYGVKPRFSEMNIVLGICKNTNPQNPLGNQGIRFGDSPIYSLKKVEEEGNADKKLLRYIFEDNVSLEVWWSGIHKTTYYSLKTNQFEVTRVVSPVITKYYKPFDFGSPEIDKLKDVFYLNEQLR